jgi:Ca-activated chloride channel family protein
MLNKEDFNNDAKDAGELGSGHTVTALYEIIPTGVKNDFFESVDSLKYQRNLKDQFRQGGNELMTIKFRYKKPDGEKSIMIEQAVTDQQQREEAGSVNFRFVSAVAEFGMLLRNSAFKQQASYNKTYKLGRNALGQDTDGYRAEFLHLVQRAGKLADNETPIEEDDAGLR